MPVVIVTSRARIQPMTLSGSVVLQQLAVSIAHITIGVYANLLLNYEGPAELTPPLTNLEWTTHSPRPESLWPWHNEPWWSWQGKIGPAPNRRAGLATWQSLSHLSPQAWDSFLHSSPERSLSRRMANQVSCQPSAHPGFGVGIPRHLHHLGPAWVCEWIDSEEPILRTSMTWQNSKISIWEECQLTFSIDGVPMTEDLNLNNKSVYEEHLQIKLLGQKGLLHDTQKLPVPVR